jgi:hypothetical protein
MIGVAKGNFLIASGSDVPKDADVEIGLSTRITKLRFGELPRLAFAPSFTGAMIPLWLLLSGVIGWIVLRELRWREKRAKLADVHNPGFNDHNSD